jgi:hypothetical protein
MKNDKLDFESWCDKYEEDLYIIVHETGEYQELDFDYDSFVESRYEKYLNE